MPIAICVISSACGWYIKVPGRPATNSYTKVLPTGIAGWVRPDFWPCVVYMAIGKFARYLSMTGFLLWLT